MVVGSTGADRFRFNKVNEGGDTILDFQVGTDTIQLNNAAGGFAALSNGTLAATSFTIGASAGDADDFIIYNAATGELFYDADATGGGAQVLVATLLNTASIDENDSFVI